MSANETGVTGSVDVYLIARIRWETMVVGSAVTHRDTFKIGYSIDPFSRLEQLRTASAHNLALFGVVMCGDVTSARAVEAGCHEMLRHFQGRGEWFNGDVQHAWGLIERRYKDSAVWLTDFYNVDIETMRLIPFPHAAWGGISDNFHAYKDYKENGVLRPMRKGPRFGANAHTHTLKSAA